jgi:hypothetical protein
MTNEDDAAQACTGCGLNAGVFQCPLCQAAELDGGYFCSQDCFAKCFVKHRDAVHKSGVVRAKRTLAEKADEVQNVERKRTAAKKRALAADVPLSAKAAEAEAADAAAMPGEEAFSDEEEELAYKAALDKELAKRKELPTWPLWPGIDRIGDATVFTTIAGDGRAGAAGTRRTTHFGASGSAVMAVDPSPPGPSTWAKSVVAIASDDVAAHLHSAALFAIQTAENWNKFHTGERTSHAVIVTGSAVAAHAVGWAARCRHVPCVIVAAGKDQPVEDVHTAAPDALLAEFKSPTVRRIIVVSYDALNKAPSNAVPDPAARVSKWLAAGPPQSKPLLITMPDIPCDPEDLQSLTAPSIFIRPASDAAKAAAASTSPRQSPRMAPKAPPKMGGKQAAAAAAAQQSVHLPLPYPSIPALTGAPPLRAEDFEPVGARYDTELSTHLCAKGDLASALAIVARIYSESKGKAEDALISILMSDWGCPSVVHAHHKLAVILRLLVDTSIKMSTMTKVKDQQSLSYIAARCVVRAVKHLPHLDQHHLEVHGIPCPFIFLDATLSYCLSRIPRSITDELAESWGFQKLGVASSFGHEDRLRAVAMHKLRTLFKPKVGVTATTFAGMLHHCIADASMRHALTVKDVRNATLWDWTCTPYGDLATFLIASQLVHRAEDMTSKTGFTRDGKKISKSQRSKIIITDNSFVSEQSVVQQHPTQKCLKLHRLQWPLLGARKRRREVMTKSALDELLSAMPSSRNVPMYLGDVGNLIGKWTAFNNRFGGYLPTSLIQFLEAFPEEFRIVGNLVTRVKDSKTQQIKIRYDYDDERDVYDSDEEKRRAAKKHRTERGSKKKKISLADMRTRRGLKTAEKTLLESKNMTKRAAKKKMKGLRNRARFDRNRKQLDPSARVPGYNRPTPKAIKGRGKKTNARVWKRQASSS